MLVASQVYTDKWSFAPTKKGKGAPFFDGDISDEKKKMRLCSFDASV